MSHSSSRMMAMISLKTRSPKRETNWIALLPRRLSYICLKSSKTELRGASARPVRIQES